MPVTINGFTLEDSAYLKDQKNSDLNLMLGENGQPKYTLSQMKSIKKERLLAEVMPLYEVARLISPKPEKVYKKRGAPRRSCKNPASAKVKKCNLIKDVVLGKLTPADAWEIVKADYFLSQICTLDELQVTERPYKARGKKAENTADGYIVAKARGE